MGYLRFYRRLRIFPGVWLNLAKTGISLSVGRRGFTVTLGRKGIRFTVGLPGTGLSYTTRIPSKKNACPGESLGADGSEPVDLETLKKQLNLE